jgi:hypothetical protein
MIRVLLVTLLTLGLNNTVFGQVDEVCGIMGPQDSTEWGIGVIKWDSGKYVKGYNEKGQATYLVSAWTIQFNNSTPIQRNRADILFAGNYENVFLKVFEIRNTSYKVLINSVDGGVWIDFNEFTSNGMTFNTYYSILFNDSRNSNEEWRKSLGSLGVNLFKSCLNLRAAPSKDSKIIKCVSKIVDDNRFHSVRIQEHQEAWAFIIVQEYVRIPDNGESGEGSAFKVENEYRGWARVIDEKGYPNLWYGLTKY